MFDVGSQRADVTPWSRHVKQVSQRPVRDDTGRPRWSTEWRHTRRSRNSSNGHERPVESTLHPQRCERRVTAPRTPACSSSTDSRSATLSLFVKDDCERTPAMGPASVTRESESMDYVSFRKGDRTGVESMPLIVFRCHGPWQGTSGGGVEGCRCPRTTGSYSWIIIVHGITPHTSGSKPSEFVPQPFHWLCRTPPAHTRPSVAQ